MHPDFQHCGAAGPPGPLYQRACRPAAAVLCQAAPCPPCPLVKPVWCFDRRCAVIVNDMAELNIDASLVKQGGLIQASARAGDAPPLPLSRPTLAPVTHAPSPASVGSARAACCACRTCKLRPIAFNRFPPCRPRSGWWRCRTGASAARCETTCCRQATLCAPALLCSLEHPWTGTHGCIPL
jgi:hypothetical protein